MVNLKHSLKMTVVQSWILRSSVVFGMVVAVVTILYFTPMPEPHFMSCERPCHELDWPMICRIKLTLEVFHTLSKSCEECPKNMSHCSYRHCISGDGHRRALLTANRELPGPGIQVCQNDIVVVDVTNKVPGQEFSIHWRGQHMQATPCMDGVPMVTQCPISSFTTFQYKFRASSPGTHLWHAHSKSHLADGIFGALIVRQADIMEPQKRLYDIDDHHQVIVISEWNRKSVFMKMDTSVSLLLNGKGNWNGYVPEFSVRKGLRYRFRLAYAAGASGCPIRFTIAQHPLKIVALDGHPTVPYEVTSVILAPGERLDFVLKAKQPEHKYLITVLSQCEQSVTGVNASLVYENSNNDNTIVQIDNKNIDKSRVFRTDVCNEPILGQVCVNEIQSLFVMPVSLRAEKVDHKLHLVFDHLSIEKYDSNKQVSYIPRINNITFTFPSSPLLTQYLDIMSSSICNQKNLPERCMGHDICECVHVEYIPLGSSVEILLVDRGDNEEDNIFHMHGHSFYVVGSRQFSEPIQLEDIEKLDKRGLLFKRNLKSPAHKDTIRLPKHGIVAIRFAAKNPGYWMFRDEHANHWTRGLDLVFQVGNQRDFQSIPADFPKCGNWIGPDFFLV